MPTSILLNEENVETQSLLDSGAGGIFLDQNYARKLKVKETTLDKPIIARNVDGTPNKRGTVKSYVNLQFKIGDKQFKERFYITGLGKQKMILGLPWLKKHNPSVDWKSGTLTWRTNEQQKLSIRRMLLGRKKWEQLEKENCLPTSPPQEEKETIMVNLIETEPDDIWINAKTNLAMDLAIDQNIKKENLTPEQIVPTEYHEFLDVFDEVKADRFPQSRPWDHKIEMKPGFEPKVFKAYNLSPEEQLELDKFLKEHLDKGYIKPSQSPMASPFFFVKKKDGKLRPCQDYRYLNDWTIKNGYPLPRISEILDRIKNAKYFTKFDIRWGYNNIRIRKEDQWKAAFKTNRGLFEPTVMFFGMCNSPATFQAMMDSIFTDMVERNEVLVYMDDILIFANTQEELERLTKEVLKRLRDNDLFLKPKKCEFNKTEVEYLGLIVEEGRLRMDPTKLSGINDWPIPKTVKDVRSFLGFGNFYCKFI